MPGSRARATKQPAVPAAVPPAAARGFDGAPSAAVTADELTHSFDRLAEPSGFELPAPSVLQAQAANRTGMPDRLKSGLEGLSGMDLSGLRVHRNSDRPARVQALAYTQGRDIHVAPGQDRHLAHEGWHAVQQMQGRVKPTMKAHGVSINDDGGLEREADVMGKKALQSRAKPSSGQ